MSMLDLKLGWISILVLACACGDDGGSGDEGGATSGSPTTSSSSVDDDGGSSAPATTVVSDSAGSGDAGGSGDTAAPGDSGAPSTGDSTGAMVDCHQACPNDPDGHTCCNEEYGFLYFCNDDNTCTMASGCEAIECCLPGPTGDNWCQMNFGPQSKCEIVSDDGRCSQ